ncbi:ferredoxin [Geodermatophilus sabuli]|uniref:Ferredoxin n=1 Tax=Geodermatophilus sabuli TaxID=1564158 RepID=A0A7K3VW66_9ACTN|nr:ferredoxin [Geodermatophilus sabuli]
MRIKVDPARCQGHNRCLDLARDLFVDDDFGYVTEVGDGSVPADEVRRAELAVLNCPEAAIELIAD